MIVIQGILFAWSVLVVMLTWHLFRDVSYLSRQKHTEFFTDSRIMAPTASADPPGMSPHGMIATSFAEMERHKNEEEQRRSFLAGMAAQGGAQSKTFGGKGMSPRKRPVPEPLAVHNHNAAGAPNSNGASTPTKPSTPAHHDTAYPDISKHSGRSKSTGRQKWLLYFFVFWLPIILKLLAFVPLFWVFGTFPETCELWVFLYRGSHNVNNKVLAKYLESLESEEKECIPKVNLALITMALKMQLEKNEEHIRKKLLEAYEK